MLTCKGDSTAKARLSDEEQAELSTLAKALNLLGAGQVRELADLLVQLFKSKDLIIGGKPELAHSIQLIPRSESGLVSRHEIETANRMKFQDMRLERGLSAGRRGAYYLSREEPEAVRRALQRRAVSPSPRQRSRSPPRTPSPRGPMKPVRKAPPSTRPGATEQREAGADSERSRPEAEPESKKKKQLSPKKYQRLLDFHARRKAARNKSPSPRAKTTPSAKTAQHGRTAPAKRVAIAASPEVVVYRPDQSMVPTTSSRRSGDTGRAGEKSRGPDQGKGKGKKSGH